ncbi:hypothetical protein Tco_0777731 [Tanacetum coccineum]
MDNPDITIEEYVQYETKKALRNGQVYNWETATYGKIRYFDDINYLRFFETKFPAIVYEDALTSELEFSSEPTVSPQHVDEVNWKSETSFSEYDDEKYNVISYNDLFPYNVFSIDNLKLDEDNDDDKIDIKQSLGDLFIKPSHNIISIDAGLNTAYPETWMLRIDFLSILNENDEVGGIDIIWYLMCAVRARIQTRFYNTHIIIEQMAKYDEKNVFWSINEEFKKVY